MEWNSLVSERCGCHPLGSATELPLPDLDTLFEYFPDEPEIPAINRFSIENEDEVQSGDVDDLDFDLVMNVFELCHRYFPSVPWQLPPRQQTEIVAHHERQARHSTRKFAEATGAKPPDPNTPAGTGDVARSIGGLPQGARKGDHLAGRQHRRHGPLSCSVW